MREQKKIQITSFDDPGFDRLIRLSKTSNKENETGQPGYLGWEYVLNPNGEALIQIAEDKNTVASQYVLLPREYSIDSRSYLGSISVNTITDPEYNGRGLFPMLAEKTFDRCADRNIKFTIGIPDGSLFHDFRHKLGFKVLGHLPLLFRPLQPIQTIVNYIRREPVKSEIDIPFGRGTVTIEDYRISKFNPVADRHLHEEFFEQFHKEKIHATTRSIDYLRWRYVDVPLRNYLFFKLVKNKKMLGYIVFRAKHVFGCRCGIVVDICSAERDMNGWRVLMEVIEYIARSSKIDFLFATAPANSFEYKVMRFSNFSRLFPFFLPKSMPLIFRPHATDLPASITDFKKWFFTFGDYDLY